MGFAFSDIFSYIRLVQISDIVDILLTAIMIYYLISWLKETRAMQLIKGVILLFVTLILSDWINLTVIHYILNAVVQVGVFAVVVIFQPELRSLLERIGRSKIGKLLDFSISDESGANSRQAIQQNIIDAVTEMAEEKTGALIVIEQVTKLGDHTKRGTTLDAEISKELIKNIFFKNSPLHDGAVIIRNGRIHSAGCFLPLSSNNNLSSDLGTRHRAALGISEVSDALIIIVSEENGKISIAHTGSLTRNVTVEPLRRALERFYDSESISSFTQLIKLRKGGAKNEK